MTLQHKVIEVIKDVLSVCVQRVHGCTRAFVSMCMAILDFTFSLCLSSTCVDEIREPSKSRNMTITSS